MNSYLFNAADHAARGKHLSLIEDLALRRMLDVYYLHETPMPLEIAATARLIGMRAHFAEVEVVLKEFFFEGVDGWRNAAADAQIQQYKDRRYQASQAGKASGIKRRGPTVQPTMDAS